MTPQFPKVVLVGLKRKWKRFLPGSVLVCSASETAGLFAAEGPFELMPEDKPLKKSGSFKDKIKTKPAAKDVEKKTDNSSTIKKIRKPKK